MQTPDTHRITQCRAQERYRVHVEFSDGASGAIDLGDLAGRGVFRLWDEEGGFAAARVGPDGQLSWGDDIELCPDAMYMRLRGVRAEDVFGLLADRVVHA
jgi:hypothetical protein